MPDRLSVIDQMLAMASMIEARAISPETAAANIRNYADKLCRVRDYVEQRMKNNPATWATHGKKLWVLIND